MTRAEQKEKRKWEIMQAGLDLFVQKGFAATKTAEIASAVGMSEGLLFHYFETKEKLYEALIELSHMGPQQVLDDSPKDPIAFFSSAAEQIINYGIKMPFVAKLFILVGQARRDGVLSQEIQKKLERPQIGDESVRLIIEGQRQGSIREGDPAALMTAFWAAIHGVMVNMIINPNTPYPKPEWIVDIIRSHKTDYDIKD